MKAKILFIVSFALLALLTSVWAADVTGKWTLQAQGVDITLNFKVDGTTLTGTVDNSQMGPADIKDGKVNGDDISFNVVRKVGETDMKIVWKGKIAGDEIKFKREAQGGMGGPGGGAPGGGGMGGPGGAQAEELVAKRAK
jgi:hypothetical protein